MVAARKEEKQDEGKENTHVCAWSLQRKERIMCALWMYIACQ
jgi:hypothetical protein